MSQLLLALILTITSPPTSNEADPIQTAVIPDDKLKVHKELSAQFEKENDPEVHITKNETTYKMKTDSGMVEVSCEVKNDDFASQCRAKNEKSKKKKSEENKSEDSHAPSASVSVTWTFGE